MNIKNDAGYGRCPACSNRLMSRSGDLALVCFNCLDGDKPKTGHTIIVTENSTKSPQEDPTAKLSVVEKDGTVTEQPTMFIPQPVSVGGKGVVIHVSLDELEGDAITVLLQKTYAALDELPAGTVRETKRVIAIQDRLTSSIPEA